MTTGPGEVAAPYLPTSRSFDEDPQILRSTLGKSYFETALAVNKRTIGTYNTFQVVTGNQFYSNRNNRVSMPIQFRQSYRQLFPFGPIATGASITIPFDMTQITETVQIYGSVITDDLASKYRSIPWTSVTNVNQQIRFDMDTTTNPNTIKITNGAGAPNIISGTIVIEYLLN